MNESSTSEVPGMPPPPGVGEQLHLKLEQLQSEVNALQIAAAEKSTPWYRKLSTVLSVIALLFSFGTTFVSYQRTKSQDTENKRQELRTTLQRLAALPKENAETVKKYADDPGTMTLIGGYINQENTLLAHHAADLVKSLPEGSVSAGEYYAIALSLQNSSDWKTSDTFLETSMNAATDFWTEISALRTIGAMRFAEGHAEAGRVRFQQALDIFSKYAGYDVFTKATTNVLTEINWACSEAANGSLPQGNQHLANAFTIVSTLPHSPGASNLNRQVMQAQSMLNSGNSTDTLPTARPMDFLLPPTAK